MTHKICKTRDRSIGAGGAAPQNAETALEVAFMEERQSLLPMVCLQVGKIYIMVLAGVSGFRPFVFPSRMVQLCRVRRYYATTWPASRRGSRRLFVQNFFPVL